MHLITLTVIILAFACASVHGQTRNQVMAPWELQNNYTNVLPLDFGSFEPSGLVYQSRLNLLLVASDVGGLLVLNVTNNMERFKYYQPTQLAGDWEALCISDMNSDNVWMVDEFPPAIQEFNFVTGAKGRRFNFPDQDLFTPKLNMRRGLESCTFVPDAADATFGGKFLFGHAATGDLYRFNVPKTGNAAPTFDSKIVLSNKPTNTKMSGLDYYADLNQVYTLWQLNQTIRVYNYSNKPTLDFVQTIVTPGYEIDGVAFNVKPFQGMPAGTASTCKSQFWVAEDTGPLLQDRAGNNLLRYALNHSCTEDAARNAGGFVPPATTPPPGGTPPPTNPPPPPAQVSCAPAPPANACKIRPGSTIVTARKGQCDQWNNIDVEKVMRPPIDGFKADSCKSAFATDTECWKEFHSLMCTLSCSQCPAGQTELDVAANFKPCQPLCDKVKNKCKTVLGSKAKCGAPLSDSNTLRGQCSSASQCVATSVKSEALIGSDSSTIYIIIAVVIGLLFCCCILCVLAFFLFRGDDDKKKREREREERIKLERKGSRNNVRRSRRSKRDKEMEQMGQYGDPNQQYMADPNAMMMDPMAMYGFDPNMGAMSYMSSDYELMRGADPFAYGGNPSTFAAGGGGTLDARIYESAAHANQLGQQQAYGATMGAPGQQAYGATMGAPGQQAYGANTMGGGGGYYGAQTFNAGGNTYKQF